MTKYIIFMNTYVGINVSKKTKIMEFDDRNYAEITMKRLADSLAEDGEDVEFYGGINCFMLTKSEDEEYFYYILEKEEKNESI